MSDHNETKQDPRDVSASGGMTDFEGVDMAQSTELDLDAIAEWFEGKAESPDTLQDVSEWHAVRDLIAEVRRLRARRLRTSGPADCSGRDSDVGGPMSDHNETRDGMDENADKFGPLHESALALVAKVEALGHPEQSPSPPRIPRWLMEKDTWYYPDGERP